MHIEADLMPHVALARDYTLLICKIIPERKFA